MFKYTKAAFEKTIEDVKKTARIFEFILAFFQIPFAVYNLITKNGIQAVNAILLVISGAYFILYLIASYAISDSKEKAERKKWKQLKAKARRAAKWLKRPVQLYSIGFLIYGIAISTGEAKPLSIILLFLQLLAFLISFIVDLLAMIIEQKKRFFVEAWQKDLDKMKEPGRKVGNFVKSIFGKDPTPKPEETKTERVLDEFLKEKQEQEEQEKREKNEQKQQAKAAKKAQKAQQKAQKKQAKAAKKALRLPQPSAELSVSDSTED